jgi:hypothetical protein
MEPQHVAKDSSDEATHIGVLGDSHWRPDDRMQFRGIGANSIVGRDELQRNLDVFIEDMNNVFEADMVVQLGDLVDGVGLDFDSQLEYLKSAISYVETGLNAPVHHLLGNHEYAHVDNHDFGEVYKSFGWENEEDSWQRIELGEVSLLLLNTACSDTPRSNNIMDHYIPENELEWLESVASQNERPTFSFTHVPLTSGDGTQYDSTDGSGRALDSLHKMDYRMGIFGHSHHAEGWSRLRSQEDRFENTHLNVPTPNALLPTSGHNHSVDDWLHIRYGIVPYLKLIVDPDGHWTAYASYHSKRIDIPTVWRRKSGNN